MLIIVYPQKKMLIIVAVNCHIGALLASAPLKPAVPPGGEASWAMGEQWKRTGETEGKRRWMRRFTGRGSSSHSAQSVCVEKASGFDQIFLCFFLTFRRLRTMANCTYASQPVAFTVRCAPPHELAMAIDRAFGGRGRRNKQNGYCAQGPASW